MDGENDTSEKKRVNFSPEELAAVRRLVVANPGVEKKLHDRKNEAHKRILWENIHREYNSNGDYSKRSIDQLKNAWKRLKKTHKSKEALIRRSKTKTGGGPPSPDVPETKEDLEMKDVLGDQQPLSTPDDDECADCPYEGESTSTATQNGKVSQKYRMNRKTSKVCSFAEQFHIARMKYLQEEHALKMSVIKLEEKYWQQMILAINETKLVVTSNNQVEEDDFYNDSHGLLKNSSENTVVEDDNCEM